MTLDERLENVSVIGAAGKMGSGIAVLLAQEIAGLKLKNKDKIYRLNLIDISEKGLDGLQNYLRSELTKTAEKGIVSLRDIYRDKKNLVENEEIVNAFARDAFSVVRFGTDLNLAKNSKMIFEAIIEDEKLKIKVFKELKNMCSEEIFFFTNTSSVPIGFLDEKAGLSGKIIGYHFYNPPVVQRLVEVITGKTTPQELKDIATELGKRLRKTLVSANDVAGFIGNGHFIRDGLYAIKQVKRLQKKHSFAGAVYVMNRVSQDFLIRPMGIFQLIDYVGIDVFQCILRVMKKHLKDGSLKSEIIDVMVERKILGGQRPDGSQKDGFLKYEKNRPVAVYSLEKGEYIPIEGKLKEDLDKKIGNLPSGFNPWKKLIAEPKKEEALSSYFANLKTARGLGARLAREYLLKTGEIAKKLVDDGIANSANDVNAVLTNGFYWLYGPINDYV
ncbi:MAG: 3-hydroxyacyl-CoA dehydrogenase family protein [Candidatus Edwardsbacteria bacterium]